MKTKLTRVRIVPILLTALLTIISVAGLVRLYSGAEEALDSALTSELKAMSKAIDPEADINDNLIYSRYSVVDSLYSADGEELYGLTKSSSAAFYSLIGAPVEGTRYLAQHYSDLFYDRDSYSLLTGLKQSRLDDHKASITISSSVQEAVYAYTMKHNVDGCAMAYDYTTGEVLAIVSSPGPQGENSKEGAYINKNLYSFTPGSVMKILISILAEMQGVDLENTWFTCNGTYTLQADGKAAVCTGYHGEINGVTAIGQSCNCYFAQLLETLNLHQVKETLRSMGFSVNEEKTLLTTWGKLPRNTSSVTLHTVWGHDCIFSIIGQDSCLLSPIDAIQLCAAVATEGQAAKAYLVEGDKVTSQLLDFLEEHSSELATVRRLWRQAYESHYVPQERYSTLISSAKTGTADELGANGNRTQRTLLGYSEDLNVAFFVVQENYIDDEGVHSDIAPWDIANYLLETISNS